MGPAPGCRSVVTITPGGIVGGGSETTSSTCSGIEPSALKLSLENRSTVEDESGFVTPVEAACAPARENGGRPHPVVTLPEK